MIVIYGTASSGKSNIAEDMAVNHSRENGSSLIYLATMEGETAAAKERIKKHRASREGKGFYTIEEPYRLSTYSFTVIGKTVLLECMSNYCANIYFKKFGNTVANDTEIEIMTEEIITSVKKLSDGAAELIVVTNDIFRDGIIYDEWSESYMKLLAHVNEGLAQMSDSFYEVVCGIPVCIKGEN